MSSSSIGSLNILAGSVTTANLDAKLGAQTPHTVAIGEGPGLANPLHWVGPYALGQILAGVGVTLDPVVTNLEGAGGITLSFSPGVITISYLTWNTPICGGTTTMMTNHGYVVTCVNTTLNMPPLGGNIGDTIEIIGDVSGGGVPPFWTIVPNGNTINFGQTTVTNPHTLFATQAFDCMDLVCVGGTNWVVRSCQGNIAHT